MQCQYLYIVLYMTTIAQVKSECSEEQLNTAQMAFKDCMDEKKASLLQTDVSEDEVQDLICSGLKDLSTGCKVPVTQFAVCRGREFVDNLVAIHLNAMTGQRENKDGQNCLWDVLLLLFIFAEVLSPFYPGVNLSSCPVFNTPAPTVVHVHQKDPEPESEPEYEPVTGSAQPLQTTVPALLMVATMLRLAL